MLYNNYQYSDIAPLDFSHILFVQCNIIENNVLNKQINIFSFIPFYLMIFLSFLPFYLTIYLYYLQQYVILLQHKILVLTFYCMYLQLQQTLVVVFAVDLVVFGGKVLKQNQYQVVMRWRAINMSFFSQYKKIYYQTKNNIIFCHHILLIANMLVVYLYRQVLLVLHHDRNTYSTYCITKYSCIRIICTRQFKLLRNSDFLELCFWSQI
eukprot:TRINITY_DN8959_c0_g1_i1.p1 TRINITY_DN8959_c0_g1~~TRINITY_DN8959_c0_g1_i1.p1  ORF type:complete len:209 (-),score=-25.90 TRINITY_DN8959_c0_g1_i1:57-683(-)